MPLELTRVRELLEKKAEIDKELKQAMEEHNAFRAAFLAARKPGKPRKKKQGSLPLGVE